MDSAGVKMIGNVLTYLVLLLCFIMPNVKADMTEAKNGDFVYKVAIRHNSNNSLICGGVLIRSNVVLTGGQCLFTHEFNNREVLNRILINVVGGNVNLSASGGEFPTSVMKVTLNANFNYSMANGARDNLGLIQLMEPIPDSLVNFARRVEIAKTTPPIGTFCKITDWPLDYRTGIRRNLHSYDVIVQPTSECNKLSLFHVSPDVSICTNWDNVTDHYNEQISLGGPLVCNGELVGICPIDVWRPRYGGIPGGYTDVTKFSNWIERNIFDGRLVEKGEHPYIVYIPLNDNFDENGTYHYCVGVLINKDTILTAAQCATLNSVTPHIGITVSPHSDYFESDIHVKELIVHSNSANNNIALIKLTEPIANITFPNLTKINTDTGSICTAVGWGPIVKYQYFYQPKYLLTVNLSIWDKKECANIYTDSKENSTICAGNPGRIRNFCEHDFGGPLFCDGVLKGIYSFGDSCTRGPDYPAVYTDVSEYIEWIETFSSSCTITSNLMYLSIVVLSAFTLI